jgi:processive 1,2-diacylglycerol beta-glucosyltransferase
MCIRDSIICIKDKEYFNILLMSGSMGLENIYYVLNELLTNENKLRITIVCGNNESLKDHIMSTCVDDYPDKKIHILGFSKDIAYLMEYSDLIISKPGGLTVTEAIVKNLPLIIPFAIPGQEMENTEFLSSNGYAYHIDKIKNINESINYLVNHPESLGSMQDRLKTLASTYSVKEIINIGNKLIAESN